MLSLAEKVITVGSHDYYESISIIAGQEGVSLDEVENWFSDFLSADPDYILFKGKKIVCFVYDLKLFVDINESDDDYDEIIKILSDFYLSDNFEKFFKPIETWQGTSEEIQEAIKNNKTIMFYRGGVGYVYGTWLYTGNKK